MTQASKLKQRIRHRMERTGEKYAVARKHVVSQVDSDRHQRTEAAADRARKAPATGAVSEAKCIEKTGHGFEYWFAVLDRFRAPSLGHKAAARHLQDAHKVSAWYAQAITVSYERARGLRVLNQAGTGKFQVSVSRVLPVAVDRATDALGQKKQRSRWLVAAGEAATALDSAMTERRIKRGERAHTLRFKYGQCTVDIRLTAKDEERATIQATISGMAGNTEVDAMRDEWRRLLDGLRDHLKSSV